MTAGEVADEIEKDADFYQGSSGGATLGGGDPIFNPAFAAEILRECKRRGIHTAVETAGYASWPAFEELITDTDLFLFDVKHMDPAVHKRYTGADNGKILDNLEKLRNAGKRIIVRTPVIPGFNDQEDDISGIADRLKEMGITEYHLLPYHRYGAEKYRYLGREYPFLCQDEQPKDGVMDRLKAVAGKRIKTVFIG
jgi:pyruvate formate lyase activating enzyme